MNKTLIAARQQFGDQLRASMDACGVDAARLAERLRGQGYQGASDKLMSSLQQGLIRPDTMLMTHLSTLLPILYREHHGVEAAPDRFAAMRELGEQLAHTRGATAVRR